MNDEFVEMPKNYGPLTNPVIQKRQLFSIAIGTERILRSERLICKRIIIIKHNNS